MSSSRTVLLAVLLLTSAPFAQAAPPAAKQPTPAQIARWVRELGDDDFSVREAASKHLLAAGEAAQAAVEKAAMSDDAEVARRARAILAKFHWGIYPDTPHKILDLITAYRTAELAQRAAIVGKLLDEGPIGCKTVARFAEMEPNVQARQMLADTISERLSSARPTLLTTENFGTLEPLLNVLLRLYVRAPSNQSKDNLFRYVAYWTLRGKLNERIAEIEPLVGRKGDEGKSYAEVLALLHRARGDLKAAQRAAEKTDDKKLLRSILHEAAAWKELARRPELLEDMPLAQRLGTRAAYLRLAGDSKGSESVLKELAERAAKPKDNMIDLFQCSKALFLNGKADEAQALLRRQTKLAMLFEIHCARLRFKVAFALVDRAREDKENNTQLLALEVLKARTLHVLGEKEKALAIFKRVGEQVKAPFDSTRDSWHMRLFKAEHQLGLQDLALEHAVRTLEGSKKQKLETELFNLLFPDQAKAAETWWDLLSQEKTDAKPLDVLKEVHAILAGKSDLKRLRQRIGKARITDRERTPSETDAVLLALAEAALAAKQRALALSVLKGADTEGALLRLGDLLAEDKEWLKAADAYQRSWEKGKKQEPLPLFLRGWSLTQAGREREGKKCMEQSHWLLLEDDKARVAFREALRQRGHVEASRRENDLLLRFGRPGGFHVSTALRMVAFYPTVRKDSLRAATAQEQGILFCMDPNIKFTQNGSYVRMPSYLFQLRARGYLEAGQRDLARQYLARCQAIFPGDSSLTIELVPLLERQGLKKEAAALYDAAHTLHEKLCREYPRSAFLHNGAAWLSACCHRDLDRGLEHALKSVQLAPEAGNLDTLAEVYFQRGDRAKAVAAQKRAVALNPKRAYFRKQLKRIEAGDPRAARPPEFEE